MIECHCEIITRYATEINPEDELTDGGAAISSEIDTLMREDIEYHDLYG